MSSVHKRVPVRHRGVSADEKKAHTSSNSSSLLNKFSRSAALILICFVTIAIYAIVPRMHGAMLSHETNEKAPSFEEIRNAHRRDSPQKSEEDVVSRDSKIDAILKNLKPEFKEKCKGILEGRQDLRTEQVWSQAFQEWFVYNNFFKGKTDGVYVDMGAHKPFSLSNTAFFDVCLGWNGICVEPVKEKAEVISGQRSCAVANHCMNSKSVEELTMYFKGNAGGDASSILTDAQADSMRKNDPEKAKSLFTCNALGAFDLFQKFKPKNSAGETRDISFSQANEMPIKIDFISLDVEGNEVEVLKCFPFEKYNVKVWAIEVNKGNVEKNADLILLANGYRKVVHLNYWNNPLDAIYVKGDQEMMWPQNRNDAEEWKRWNVQAYPRCD